jgi:hypothetical protein
MRLVSEHQAGRTFKAATTLRLSDGKGHALLTYTGTTEGRIVS